MATTVAESVPPDKNAPIGTSAIMRPRTASRSNSSSVVAASSADRSTRGGCETTSVKRQNGVTFGSPPDASVRIEPGGSFCTPRKIVAGAGT